MLCLTFPHIHLIPYLNVKGKSRSIIQALFQIRFFILRDHDVQLLRYTYTSRLIKYYAELYTLNTNIIYDADKIQQ
jgi:hypothetical protein